MCQYKWHWPGPLTTLLQTVSWQSTVSAQVNDLQGSHLAQLPDTFSTIWCTQLREFTFTCCQMNVKHTNWWIPSRTGFMDQTQFLIISFGCRLGHFKLLIIKWHKIVVPIAVIRDLQQKRQVVTILQFTQSLITLDKATAPMLTSFLLAMLATMMRKQTLILIPSQQQWTWKQRKLYTLNVVISHKNYLAILNNFVWLAKIYWKSLTG